MTKSKSQSDGERLRQRGREKAQKEHEKNREEGRKNYKAEMGQLLNKYSDLADMEYDGIAGILPDWVPEPKRGKFESTIIKLLTQYSLGKVRENFKDYKDTWFDEDWQQRMPELGSFNYPFEIEADLAFLCDLERCVYLGEVVGLELLAGKSAVRGSKVSKGSSIGGKERAVKYTLEKERVLEIGRELIRKRPEFYQRKHGGKSSLSLAVVNMMSKEDPYKEDDRYKDSKKRADAVRNWLNILYA